MDVASSHGDKMARCFILLFSMGMIVVCHGTITPEGVPATYNLTSVTNVTKKTNGTARSSLGHGGGDIFYMEGYNYYSWTEHWTNYGTIYSHPSREYSSSSTYRSGNNYVLYLRADTGKFVNNPLHCDRVNREIADPKICHIR